MTQLIFGMGGSEMIFIIFVVMLLFGGKKIPELMKGLGKGIKHFKEGMNGIDEITDPVNLLTDKTEDKKE